MDNFLAQCVVAREVWFLYKLTLGSMFKVPSANITVEDWWLRERARIQERDRRWFDTLFCTTWHMLWKNRNAWCFGNTRRQTNATILASHVMEVRNKCSYG
jgi:hypothetical protein